MDDIAGVVLVLLPQVLEDPDLLLRLPVEPLFVPHHLESHVLVGLVVVHLEHLPKRPFPYHLQDLVPGGREAFILHSLLLGIFASFPSDSVHVDNEPSEGLWRRRLL